MIGRSIIIPWLYRRRPVWKLAQGLEFIRRHQNTAFKLHYNLSLGGGVLNRGVSYKDLDIVCVPANGDSATPESYDTFVRWVKSISGTLMPCSHLWNNTTFKYTFKDAQDRLIDWFVVFDAGQSASGMPFESYVIDGDRMCVECPSMLREWEEARKAVLGMSSK